MNPPMTINCRVLHSGLASQLKTFPDNEIRRGQFAMKLKAISRQAEEILKSLVGSHW
jgi:hypothetical protein